MADYIRYNNRGATRNRPLSPELVNALGFLSDMGVTAEVFSGGQPTKEEGGDRVGSVRHDHGGAGDMFFYQGDRKLDWANESDRPLFEEIVRRGKEAGITGFGAGEGYMRPGSMHVGFGNPGVWGAGGDGNNAPGWLRSAYGTTLNSQPKGVQQLAAAGRDMAPELPPAREIADRPIASAPAVAPDPSALSVFQDKGFMEGMKTLGGTDAAKGGLGLLAGALGGGGGGQNAQARAHETPIQSSLPAMEAADAGRMQAAQQLMSSLMVDRPKRRLGSTGLNLMG